MSEGLIAAAAERYRAGDVGGAASLLEPSLADPAPSPDALRILGLCRLRTGDLDAALDLLARARSAAPDDPWTALHYGIALQAAGRIAEAIPLFAHCVAALPNDPAPLLNLASAMLAAGDVATAMRHARRARLRAPASPQAHYTLGLVCLAASRWADGAQAFRRAADLAPGFAEAWANLGVASYRQGLIGAAVQAFRAALRADPGNAAAAEHLGGLMRLTGESASAETLLRDIIARHPDAMAPRLTLAAGLLQERRAAEAMALLDRPTPRAPDLRQPWLLQRALGQIELGALAEARATLGEIGAVPPALLPLLQWRRVLLALREGAPERARREAETMALALDAAESALPEHRITGHCDLARYWSGVDDPPRAMAQWTIAHRLLAQIQPFSRAQYAGVVDATLAQLDAARFTGARAANRDEAPVFVVGMPRSGTTLMERILSAHPAVHGAGARAALPRAVDALGGGNDTAADPMRIAALDGPALDAAATRYLAELHRLAPDAARIVDTTLDDVRHLGLVGLMLPGARIIACERDPRDTGLSIFTHRICGSHGYAHDLADLGWYIAQQRRLMAHWRAALPNPILTVNLREWVDDFLGTLRRVLDFLDLPDDAACETAWQADRRLRTVSPPQVHQPIDARGIGRWRRYATELAPLITALREGGVKLDD